MTEQRVPWWKTDLGEAEIEAVARAIRDRRIAQGPLVEELEGRLAERLGVPSVAATTSGSVALLLSLMAAGVGPGDEVVVPAETFIAPAHAARLLGARIKLVDVCRERALIAPELVAAALTERTRAVVAVHLGGRACDVEAIERVVAGRGIAVIEDCAQAFCSRGAAGTLGTGGNLAAFSMGLTKLMTSAEGGFVATGGQGLDARLRCLRNHGVEKIADNVFDGVGCNFRLTDVQAAIALAQLDRLDEKIAGVKRVYRFYQERLRDLGYLEMLEVRVDDGELPLWSEALCAERDEVVRLLDERGIEAKPFHPPLARSAHLEAGGSYPNAERVAAMGLTLPSGPDQAEENLERTVAALVEIAQLIETPVGAS